MRWAEQVASMEIRKMNAEIQQLYLNGRAHLGEHIANVSITLKYT
jgi:hypothetical protein